MRTMVFGLLGLGLLGGMPCRADDGHPLLASAPVDIAMFRDGEVRRSTEPFGRWTLVCDSIARLGHRFCSLRSAPVLLGGASVDLLVSSGDDGRPAALMRLPFGLSLPFGVAVTPVGQGRGGGRHVPIALCGPAGCEAAWTLDADEIAALRHGGGLRLAVRGWQFGHGAPSPVDAVIASAGFADAVTASLR